MTFFPEIDAFLASLPPNTRSVWNDSGCVTFYPSKGTKKVNAAAMLKRMEQHLSAMPSMNAWHLGLLMDRVSCDKAHPLCEDFEKALKPIRNSLSNRFHLPWQGKSGTQFVSESLRSVFEVIGVPASIRKINGCHTVKSRDQGFFIRSEADVGKLTADIQIKLSNRFKDPFWPSCGYSAPAYQRQPFPWTFCPFLPSLRDDSSVSTIKTGKQKPHPKPNSEIFLWWRHLHDIYLTLVSECGVAPAIEIDFAGSQSSKTFTKFTWKNRFDQLFILRLSIDDQPLDSASAIASVRRHLSVLPVQYSFLTEIVESLNFPRLLDLYSKDGITVFVFETAPQRRLTLAFQPYEVLQWTVFTNAGWKDIFLDRVWNVDALSALLNHHQQLFKSSGGLVGELDKKLTNSALHPKIPRTYLNLRGDGLAPWLLKLAANSPRILEWHSKLGGSVG